MHRKFIAIALCITAVFSLIACGKTASNAGSQTKNDNYIKSLKDGVYYVRQQDTNKCTPVYFGNATFSSGSVKTSSDAKRILWFKDDFDKIPTLYKGDSLIMYSKDKFEEKMVFERFEDYGYTIGICGMEELKSGRYSISTDISDFCTYPGGDTDEILKLASEGKCDTVTLDTVGNRDVRVVDKDNKTSSFLSRSGTLKGLEKDKSYKVMVYAGTVGHEYTFKANVRALGSMEVRQTYDYSFDSGALINITIPSDFKSGYYLINGEGLFRYVNGSAYDENTDFNITNDSTTTVNPGAATTYTGTNTTTATTSASSNSLSYIPAYDNSTSSSSKTASEITNTFKVKSPGQITVKSTFTNNGLSVSATGITAEIQTPSGARLSMVRDTTDSYLSKTFQAETGDYTVVYYGLNSKTPRITVDVK